VQTFLHGTAPFQWKWSIAQLSFAMQFHELWLLFPYQIFENDTIFISVQGPWSFCFLWIIIQCHLPTFKFVATQRLHLGWKRLCRKHSFSCDESRSHSLLLAKIWPVRGPQTWNNFQSYWPFSSYVISGWEITTQGSTLLLYTMYQYMQVASRCRMQAIYNKHFSIRLPA
jgi:hypothetical protein